MSLLVTACVVFVTFLPGQSPAQPGEADALARAREVLAAIAAKDFSKVEQQFDEKVKAALPPGRLEALWTGLQIQLGAFKQCAGEPRVRTIDDKRMVITACDFERAKADAQFAFDTQGRISGLAFRPAAAAPVPYTLPSCTPTRRRIPRPTPRLNLDSGRCPPRSPCQPAPDRFRPSCSCTARARTTATRRSVRTSRSRTWPWDSPLAAWPCCASRSARRYTGRSRARRRLHRQAGNRGRCGGGGAAGAHAGEDRSAPASSSPGTVSGRCSIPRIAAAEPARRFIVMAGAARSVEEAIWRRRSTSRTPTAPSHRTSRRGSTMRRRSSRRCGR